VKAITPARSTVDLRPVVFCDCVQSGVHAVYHSVKVLSKLKSTIIGMPLLESHYWNPIIEKNWQKLATFLTKMTEAAPDSETAQKMECIVSIYELEGMMSQDNWYRMDLPCDRSVWPTLSLNRLQTALALLQALLRREEREADRKRALEISLEMLWACIIFEDAATAQST
jgi:hypothetical protein